MTDFLTHLFIVIFSLITFGMAAIILGLVWYGAFVVWSYIF